MKEERRDIEDNVSNKFSLIKKVLKKRERKKTISNYGFFFQQEETELPSLIRSKIKKEKKSLFNNS